MPINVVDLTGGPQCISKQWFITDLDTLAHLAALVLLGRARHAARILEGAQREPAVAAQALKERLRRDLLLADNVDHWHRDGLLFEVICWLVARMTAGSDEAVSDPHLKATQQGADMIKVQFDPTSRSFVCTTVYEHKCTDRARRRFKREVLPAFAEYVSGVRDDQLTQTTIGLLQHFELSDAEHLAVYDKLVQERPLAFRAALTVTPEDFGAAKCAKLFKGYNSVATPLGLRTGDTFPLPDIRQWFDEFARAVWKKIEPVNV